MSRKIPKNVESLLISNDDTCKYMPWKKNNPHNRFKMRLAIMNVLKSDNVHTR